MSTLRSRRARRLRRVPIYRPPIRRALRRAPRKLADHQALHRRAARTVEPPVSRRKISTFTKALRRLDLPSRLAGRFQVISGSAKALVCKKRPDARRAAKVKKGSGSGPKFVPWCRRR
jgi:hypothetical protein